jgi:nitroreductase
MELRQVLRARRMVRRYAPDQPVADESLRRVLGSALRGPSAGFAQGSDFLVLNDPADRSAFWRLTSDDVDRPDAWLGGMMTAPVLIMCLADPDAYLDRYAEDDKGFTDRDASRWPVPYWDVDTGMAALLMLLTAVDEGLGACFFGIPGHAHPRVRARFGIPERMRLVGMVSLGHVPTPPPPGRASRPRRTLDDAVHWGRFGA